MPFLLEGVGPGGSVHKEGVNIIEAQTTHSFVHSIVFDVKGPSGAFQFSAAKVATV